MIDTFCSSLRRLRKHIAKPEIFLIIAGLIIFARTLKPEIVGDGEMRFDALRSLYFDHVIVNVKYSYLQMLLSLPLAWLADILGWDVKHIVAYFNFIIFSLGTLLSYFPLRQFFGGATARLSILVLIGTSMFAYHMQFYYGEVLSGMLLWNGFLYSPRNRALSALFLALGVMNTPALLAALIVASLFGSTFYLSLKSARHMKARILFAALAQNRYSFLLGAAVLASLLILGELAFKYESFGANFYFSSLERSAKTPLPYSGQPGFSYPLFLGLLSILLSFGKGLIFYVPGFFLCLNERLRQCLAATALPWAAAAVFAAVSILTYSKWWAWSGDWFWGPRFFVYLCLPTSLFFAVLIERIGQLTWSWRILLAVALCLSFWVSFDGFVYGQKDMTLCWSHEFEPYCWYTPEFSALWRPFISGFDVPHEHRLRLLYAGLQGATVLILAMRFFVREPIETVSAPAAPEISYSSAPLQG